MKKVLLLFLTLAGILLLALFLNRYHRHIIRLIKPQKSNTIELNNSEAPLAVFSFRQGAKNKILDSYLHYTVKLHNTKKLKIRNSEIRKIEERIPIIITIETWKTVGLPSYTNNVLAAITNGKYDDIIKKICTDFIGERPNVYLRLNPDMEVPVNRYPWQLTGGQTYIPAFRHFATLCKKYAPQAKLIWGPAGYPGAMEYYPGDDVVDVASVTINSKSESPLNVYPKNYSTAYDVFRRVHRLRFIDKTIFILGSEQANRDSINEQLISSLSKRIDNERKIIYSPESFERPKQETKITGRQKIEIGIFDEFERLNNEEAVTVEHLFANFRKLDDGTFENEFRKVIERGNSIIVTFEPFRGPNEEQDRNVLQNITDGKYDNEINRFYSIICSTNLQVYLRYAHEMEIPITRYPWQSQDPITYITSYRYFMTFENPLSSNIKRIWGPAGDRGSLEWWPGNDLVDFVSIAIYGLPDKNITDPEKQESFEKIFNRKIWRLRLIDKPVFITEFGVKGPEEYQTKWLNEAAVIIRNNPQIKGINYFNMSDTPKAWGEIKPPDWSITKNTFYNFLEALNE